MLYRHGREAGLRPVALPEALSDAHCPKQRTTFDVSLRKTESIFRILDHRQSESVRRKAHRIPEISMRLTPLQCRARIGRPGAPEALQRYVQRHQNANSTAGSLQLDTTNASDSYVLSKQGRIHFLHRMPINNIVILNYIKPDENHLHGQYLFANVPYQRPI